jgi:hypothetical protein
MVLRRFDGGTLVTAIKIPEQLGYRARKVRRAAMRLGRARGMTLVANQFERNQLTVDNWAPAFRERFGGQALSDDDLALSLAGHPRQEPPGPGWPTQDLARVYEQIASYASPDPDDIQAAREVLELGDLLPPEINELAQQTIRDYVEITPAKRARWQIDERRFDRLTDALAGRGSETAT